MKTSPIITIFFIIITILSVSFIDSEDDIINNVATAINSGNSKELSKYFNTTIDLTVPGNEGTFSKAQAELIVKDFFIKYPPQSFTINNQGSSKGGAKFCIGTFKTDKNTFRTYFLIKQTSGKYSIQQLQFEKE